MMGKRPRLGDGAGAPKRSAKPEAHGDRDAGAPKRGAKPGARLGLSSSPAAGGKQRSAAVGRLHSAIDRRARSGAWSAASPPRVGNGLLRHWLYQTGAGRVGLFGSRGLGMRPQGVGVQVLLRQWHSCRAFLPRHSGFAFGRSRPLSSARALPSAWRSPSYSSHGLSLSTVLRAALGQSQRRGSHAAPCL